MEFSAGGIVYKRDAQEEKFVLILNSYGQWTFPKGHIEKGESPEQAALREVAEEIGLTDLKIITQIDKIDYWFKLEGHLYHKYVYFFLMEAPPTAELKPQEAEIGDAAWFSAKETLKRLYYKDDTPLFKKVLNQIQKQ